jgi:hypothetical protein
MTKSTTSRTVFTRLALIFTIAVAVALTGGPISPVNVAAQGFGNGGACSNHTLRGDYGLLASGILRLPPFLGGGSEHFAATAMWTFNGDGTLTQGLGAALHGEVTGTAPDRDELPGTYSVNPNCTGTMALQVPELPFPIEYAIVIVDNAREIKGIVTSATSTTTVSLTRQ